MTFPTDPSYTAQALRTESPITPALQTRLRDTPRLVHAVLGLLTEAGELADPVKKHIYYGRPLDLVNLREEIGDCLWYLAIAADALGTTLEAEQARNLAKLRARYPHVFTAEAAQVRDLDREREVLEEHVADDPHTLRQQLAAAQRAVSDAFAEVNSLRQQLDDARYEIETLNGAMAPHFQRLRDAEERIWPGVTWGCDAAEKMADEIISLRKQLTDARAETVEVRRRLNEETDRHRKTNSEKIELFQQKESANQHNAELVKARDAAHMTILAQRAGIERLQAFFERVRCEAHEDPELYYPFARLVLQFNAGSIEPAPCQGCERLRAELADEEKCRQLQVAEIERLDAFVSKVRAARDEHNGLDRDARVEAALAELDADTQPTPVAEPATCPEVERLQVFEGKVRMPDCYREVIKALAELDEDTQPTPVAEPVPCPECERLGRELAEAKRAASDKSNERQVLTVEQQQDVDAMRADTVHPSYAPLVSGLRKQLSETKQTLGCERLEAEALGYELGRLLAFVEQVRSVVNSELYGLEMTTVRELLHQLDTRTLKSSPVAETAGGRSMNAMLPPTIRPEDWFPCEPDEDGSYCLHEGMQYLAAMRFFDGPKEHFECEVVTVSYQNGYLVLETGDAEIEPTEVAFLALLEGRQ